MQALTVGQVCRYLSSLLDGDLLLSDLWVSGEVSNLSRSAAGHLYFTLKDDQGQIGCVCWRSNALGVEVAAGDAVLAHGYVSFYDVRGQLQFYVDLVRPEGQGLLQAEFARLRARLEAEGLFDESRKRPLPAFPQRVGVVTSPQSAVWHDVMTIARRRYPLAELVLAATPVQGEGAAGGVAEALRALNARGDIDVIIVARGGGSLEELWPFNEEVVARAIHASHTPVVSAIGHETDVTIADYVADARAPTPSAAAELVLPDAADLKLRLATARRRLASSARALVEAQRECLAGTAQGLRRAAPAVARRRQRLDDLLRHAYGRVAALLAPLRERVTGRERQVLALGPANTLARGYAIATSAGGRVVRRASEVRVGEEVRVRLSEGGFRAGVTDVEDSTGG